MIILAVDPGTEISAWVVFEAPDKILEFRMDRNELLVELIATNGCRAQRLVIEQVKSYGNVMGDCILETVFWSGRFAQAFAGPVSRIPRKTIVTHICMNPRASDTNVRQALIDRFGGKTLAVGSKARPGPLYGVKNDIWSALAVAVAWTELDQDLQNKLK